MLTRLKLDPARMELIGGFLRDLPQAKHRGKRGILPRTETIMQITTSWHEKGRMEGRMEAKKETSIVFHAFCVL